MQRHGMVGMIKRDIGFEKQFGRHRNYPSATPIRIWRFHVVLQTQLNLTLTLNAHANFNYLT